jgi:hypothetical protein
LNASAYGVSSDLGALYISFWFQVSGFSPAARKNTDGLIEKETLKKLIFDFLSFFKPYKKIGHRSNSGIQGFRDSGIECILSI